MTDKHNEYSESAEDSLSFKNQILRDLQEATRLRSLREEEHKKSAAVPETPLSMSADSHAIDSGSASNKVSNQNLSSHSVAHSAIAKTCLLYTSLFSINCKTGYYVGNGSGHSDKLDY